jgi:hypothetical protein
MRARGTLILLVLCLAVGGYLWFVERGKPTGEEAEKATRRLFEISPAAMRRFQLDYGDSVLVLESAGSAWRITAPAAFPADEEAVDKLTSFFSSLTAERLLPRNQVDSTATGLARPWVRVTIHAAADSTQSGAQPARDYVLAFGYQNPTRTAYYTQVDDRPDLALLDASTIDGAIRRPLSAFRDRHLARFDTERAAAIDLATPERTLALRREDGRWWLQSPKALADEEAVLGLLTRIANLKAVEFAQASPPAGAAIPGLAHPALELTVRNAGDTLLARLTVGPALPAKPGESQVLHLVRSSAVEELATLDSEEMPGLTVGPDELRDRRLLDLTAGEIDSLEIMAAGKWVRGAAADTAFAAVIASLPDWRATRFVAGPGTGPELVRYGLAPAQAAVRAHLRNGATREVYLGGEDAASGGVYAQRPQVPDVVVAPRDVLDAIQKATGAGTGSKSGSR